jgi:hypothetical protein
LRQQNPQFVASGEAGEGFLDVFRRNPKTQQQFFCKAFCGIAVLMGNDFFKFPQAPPGLKGPNTVVQQFFLLLKGVP